MNMGSRGRSHAKFEGDKSLSEASSPIMRRSNKKKKLLSINRLRENVADDQDYPLNDSLIINKDLPTEAPFIVSMSIVSGQNY